jgi:hypothetical protein
MEATEVIKSIEGTDVWNNALSAGLKPSEIVGGISDKLVKYGEKRAISIATAAITREISNLDKEFVTVKGIVVGSTDRFGSKSPVTYHCLDNKGKPFKIATWDHNLITFPNIVEVKGEFNQKYGNIIVSDVLSTDTVKNNIAEKLATVAMEATSDFTHVEQYQVISVKGVIRWINPSAKFENSERVGSHEIMETKEYPNADLHPVLDISLDPMESNNRINLQLKRQRAGNPLINIEDFVEIVRDGYTQNRGDPKKQSKYVEDALRGVEVMAVGEVSSIKEVWNADNNQMNNFINLSISYIEEIGFDGESIKKPVNPQKKEETPKKEEKPKKPKKSEEKKEEPVKEEKDKDYSEVVRDIITLAKILKRHPNEITPSEIRTQLEIKLTDTMIKAAIEKAEAEYKKFAGRSK